MRDGDDHIFQLGNRHIDQFCIGRILAISAISTGKEGENWIQFQFKLSFRPSRHTGANIMCPFKNENFIKIYSSPCVFYLSSKM